MINWKTVDEAPSNTALVLVFTPKTDADFDDVIGFDYREDGYWVKHAELYDDFVSCGGYDMCGPDISVSGPDEMAPYTHFAEINFPIEKAKDSA